MSFLTSYITSSSSFFLTLFIRLKSSVFPLTLAWSNPSDRRVHNPRGLISTTVCCRPFCWPSQVVPFLEGTKTCVSPKNTRPPQMAKVSREGWANPARTHSHHLCLNNIHSFLFFFISRLLQQTLPKPHFHSPNSWVGDQAGCH